MYRRIQIIYITLSCALARTYWQFARLDGTLARSQSVGPVTQRAVPVDQSGLFGRL